MPTRNVIDSAIWTLANATSTGVDDQNFLLDIFPGGAVLLAATVWLDQLSLGSIWVLPTLVVLGERYNLGNGGWIRSDATFRGVDPYSWSGRIPYPSGGQTRIQLLARNDTGSTATIHVSVILEVPA